MNLILHDANAMANIIKPFSRILAGSQRSGCARFFGSLSGVNVWRE